jgi:hypothetical protein
VPGTGISIVGPDDLVARTPDRVLLSFPTWSTRRRAFPGIGTAGGRRAMPDPEPRPVEVAHPV